MAVSSRSQTMTLAPGAAARICALNSPVPPSIRPRTTAWGERRLASATIKPGLPPSDATSMPPSCRSWLIPSIAIGSRLPSSTTDLPASADTWSSLRRSPTRLQRATGNDWGNLSCPFAVLGSSALLLRRRLGGLDDQVDALPGHLDLAGGLTAVDRPRDAAVRAGLDPAEAETPGSVARGPHSDIGQRHPGIRDGLAVGVGDGPADAMELLHRPPRPGRVAKQHPLRPHLRTALDQRAGVAGDEHDVVE